MQNLLPGVSFTPHAVQNDFTLAAAVALAPAYDGAAKGLFTTGAEYLLTAVLADEGRAILTLAATPRLPPKPAAVGGGGGGVVTTDFLRAGVDAIDAFSAAAIGGG